MILSNSLSVANKACSQLQFATLTKGNIYFLMFFYFYILYAWNEESFLSWSEKYVGLFDTGNVTFLLTVHFLPQKIVSIQRTACYCCCGSDGCLFYHTKHSDTVTIIKIFLMWYLMTHISDKCFNYVWCSRLQHQMPYSWSNIRVFFYRKHKMCTQ